MDKETIIEIMKHTRQHFDDGVFGSIDNQTTRHLAASNMSSNIWEHGILFQEIAPLVEDLCELALFGERQ